MFPCPNCGENASVYGCVRVPENFLDKALTLKRSLQCKHCGTRFQTLEKFAGIPRDYELKNGGMISWLGRRKADVTMKRLAGTVKKTPRAGKKNPRGVEQT